MRIVCDTNILISAIAFPGGLPERILRAAISGTFMNCVSPDILTEFTRVLEKKLRFSIIETDQPVRLISAVSTIVYPETRLEIVKDDETDNRILECAVAARAEYLVTGDKRHLLPLKKHGEIRIVSARDLVLETRLVQ